MIELWKKSITAGISMKHPQPKVFITTQWQRRSEPSIFYLVYRWTVALFFFISWVLSIIDLRHLDQSASDRAKWLVYLTNWGFTTCTVQAIMVATLLTIALANSRKTKEPSADEDNKVLKLYKIYWATNIAATDMAFGITIIYWSLIYNGWYNVLSLFCSFGRKLIFLANFRKRHLPIKLRNGPMKYGDITRYGAEKMPLDAMNIIVHAVNSILMLLDIVIVAHPVRILHFYWPLLMGIFYVTFNFIYYLAGGTSKEGKRYIYKILNWDNALFTISMCMMVSVFLILLHCFTYGIYKMRTNLYERLMKGSREEDKKPCSTTTAAYDNAAMTSDLV